MLKKVNTGNGLRLENILSFADNLLNYGNINTNPNSIFSLIKILSDKITLEYSMELIEERGRYPTLGVLTGLFVDIDEGLNKKYNLGSRIYNDVASSQVLDEFKINLSTDPVIMFPWNKERLAGSLSGIGTITNTWKEDLYNHRVQIYFPVGLCHFYNGIHSSFSGMIKRQGVINITDDSYHVISNFSKLYDYIRFDGDNYIFTEENLVIGPAQNFEIGCIFEIGRKLHERKINFKNLELQDKK